MRSLRYATPHKFNKVVESHELTFRQPYYLELIDEFFPQKVIKW